jgi:uncharacterized DUF497 family protein
MAESPVDSCVGFDWDDGNLDKNWRRHRVAWWECEEVFFNRPRPIFEDVAHSEREPRLFLLGQSNAGRWLFVSFTVRNDLIRPISARDMNARERRTYELFTKRDSDL